MPFSRLALSLRSVLRAVVLVGAMGASPWGAQALAHPARAALWFPAANDAPVSAVRASLARALSPRGYVVVDVPATEPITPSLREALVRANDEYRARRLDEAAGAFARLIAEAARVGGGDLDRHALGDVFLSDALTQHERGRDDLAWEMLVTAARIDPTRMLDPARVSPRAIAAHHRAIAELAQQPRIDVELRLPKGARLIVDGETTSAEARLSLPTGTHYVQVLCEGYQPWRGTFAVAPPRSVLAVMLQPMTPPPLATLQDASTPVAAAIYRGKPDGPWRLAVGYRDGGGRTTDASDALASDVDASVRTLVDTALGPLSVAAAPQPRRPIVKQWWLWTAVGASAAALAIGLGVGLTRPHDGPPGTVAGRLEPPIQ